MKDIFPRAVAPPKLVRAYGPWLGFVVASVSALFGLVHLFSLRFMTEILDAVVPGGAGWAGFLVVVIVLAEVFAVPFALRLRLSPLAHVLSGYFIVLAPLLWLLVTLWALGTPDATGQFGTLGVTPDHGVLLVLNVVWLGTAFYALYALGYNRFKLSLLGEQFKK